MIRVVGDLHFGMRRSSPVFHSILMDELRWFYSEIDEGDDVVCLGDVFDSRSSIDFKILIDSIEFFKALSKKAKKIYILSGNHDLYYKDSSQDVNCKFLEKVISNLQVVDENKVIKVSGKECLFVPWIIDGKAKEKTVKDIVKFNKKTNGAIFGHFDIAGLYDESVPVEENYLNSNTFIETHVNLSGHYHKRSTRGHLVYGGSFISQSFNDVENTKGYYNIHDDNKLEFIKGNSPTFEVLQVDNPNMFIEGFEKLDESAQSVIKNKVEGNFIRLELYEYKKENDSLYKLIKDMNPRDVSISFTKMSSVNIDEVEDFDGFDHNSDIIEIIRKYVTDVIDIPEGIDSDKVLINLNGKYKDYQQLISA